jgi:hypothetical protein
VPSASPNPLVNPLHLVSGDSAAGCVRAACASCCWPHAARIGERRHGVVGTAMGNCDGPNLMGDAFFTARLNSLIDAGRIEASGPRTTLRD